MRKFRVLSSNIQLEATINSQGGHITVLFRDTPLSTRRIPQLGDILEQEIPTIFNNKCFNDEHLPFREEVKATEIGHLLEHILMEYVCINHEVLYPTPIVIKGLTSWNWFRDQVGTFKIDLTSKMLDEKIFETALDQTMALFEVIFESIEPVPSLLPLLFFQQESAMRPAVNVLSTL